MKSPIPFIARILLCFVFIVAGIGKITNFAGSLQYMTAFHVPLAPVLLVIAILIEVLGGLSILLGFKARFSSIIMAIYLVIVTLIFHTKFSEPMMLVMFEKNLAIIGGLLLVFHFGPGPISFDEKVKPPEMA
ncbi:MAG TPA: DoxX family protein [Terriglobales bacterium]|nr:DoxX family protein [Terriglobales bacterium]